MIEVVAPKVFLFGRFRGGGEGRHLACDDLPSWRVWVTAAIMSASSLIVLAPCGLPPPLAPGLPAHRPEVTGIAVGVKGRSV